MRARLLMLTLLLLSAPLRAGQNVWTPIGPEGGTVSALAFAANGRTLYAGTPSGQVFKSVNTGRTWSPTGPGPRGALRDLETDPAQPARVYAATSEGIWRSEDAGRSWLDLTGGLPGVRRPVDVLTVVVDPLSSGVVYLSLDSGFAGAPRVFRSADRGASWQLATSGLPRDGIVRSLAAHPRQHGILFAATLSGLFRSSDSGRTWQRSGLRGSDVVDVAVDALEPSRLYAVRMATPEEPPHLPAYPQILVSEDGGGRWRLSGSTVSGFYEGHIEADPLSPGTAYFFSQYSDVYKTTDAGRHWTAILFRGDAGVVTYTGIRALALHPSQSGTLLAGRSGDHSHAILRTTDGGALWSSSGSGLRTLGIDRVDADPASPSILYADLWRTSDGGHTWIGPEGLPEDTPGALAVDPGQPSTLYFASSSSLSKSTDRGMTWTRIGPVPAAAIQLLIVAAPGTLYAANPGGIYRSADGGATWEALPGAHGFDTRFLAAAPSRPWTLYAAYSDGLAFTVLRSTDAGATWTTVLQPGRYRWIEDLAVDPHDPDRALVAFSRRDGDLDPIGGGVYWTADGGATWRLSRLDAGNPPAFSLSFDPRHPSRLYAGSFGKAFLSEDAGVTWTPLPGGLPSARVGRIAADPFALDTIYAPTGGGLYSLTLGIVRTSQNDL